MTATEIDSLQETRPKGIDRRVIYKTANMKKTACVLNIYASLGSQYHSINSLPVYGQVCYGHKWRKRRNLRTSFYSVKDFNLQTVGSQFMYK